MNWTPDMDAALRHHYEAGKTFAEIGPLLDKTRSAIAARVHRLGLPKRGAAFSANKRWQRDDRPAREVRGRPSLKGVRQKPMRIECKEAPGSVPVVLWERSGCCYPTNEGGPYLFCNEPVQAKASYCEFHRRRMFNDARES